MQRCTQLASAFLAFAVSTACHKKTPVAVTPPAPAPQTTVAAPPAAPPSATPVTQRRARTVPALTPAASPAATPPAAPAEPDFQLGRAVTADEERAANAEIDRRIQHANQVLESIGGRPLTAQQKSSLGQIRGFIAQAQQMRSTDVVRARSLAERADVLSQDLASTLR